MALLNVHPDYMCFSGAPKPSAEFPAELYRQFLCYVKDRYAGSCWQPLPREVAAFCRQQRRSEGYEMDPNRGFSVLSGSQSRKTVIAILTLSNIINPLLSAVCDSL